MHLKGESLNYNTSACYVFIPSYQLRRHAMTLFHLVKQGSRKKICLLVVVLTFFLSDRWTHSCAETAGELDAQQSLMIQIHIEGLGSIFNVDRQAAADALGEIGPDAKGAIDALVERLKDEAWPVRKAASLALGKIGPESIPILMTVLEDEDENVRKLAIEALGGVGPPAKSVIPTLVGMMNGDFFVEETVIIALGKIRDPSAVEILSKLTSHASLGGEAKRAINRIQFSEISELEKANPQSNIGLLLFNQLASQLALLPTSSNLEQVTGEVAPVIKEILEQNEGVLLEEIVKDALSKFDQLDTVRNRRMMQAQDTSFIKIPKRKKMKGVVEEFLDEVMLMSEWDDEKTDASADDTKFQSEQEEGKSGGAKSDPDQAEYENQPGMEDRILLEGRDSTGIEDLALVKESGDSTGIDDLALVEAGGDSTRVDDLALVKESGDSTRIDDAMLAIEGGDSSRIEDLALVEEGGDSTRGADEGDPEDELSTLLEKLWQLEWDKRIDTVRNALEAIERSEGRGTRKAAREALEALADSNQSVDTLVTDWAKKALKKVAGKTDIVFGQIDNQKALKKTLESFDLETELDDRPHPIRVVTALYPEAAVEDRTKGKVIVRILVGVSGTVEEVEVVEGKEIFQDAAVQAAGQFRFRPGKRGGEQTAFWVQMPFEFWPASQTRF